MKNLIFIAFISIVFTSCKPANKYIIQAGDNRYQTNSYSKDERGCIIFKNYCGCGEDPAKVMICGSYLIKENPGYEKN